MSLCHFRIFGHHGSAADDIIYINWLNMVRAGLLALEFYTPDTQAWKQVGKVIQALVFGERKNGRINIPHHTAKYEQSTIHLIDMLQHHTPIYMFNLFYEDFLSHSTKTLETLEVFFIEDHLKICPVTPGHTFMLPAK